MDASAKSPAELERELETRTRELAEAREHLAEALARETATSEVLQVISSSPGGLEPVFESMLANATKLCEAGYGAMWLREGDGFRTVALHGTLPAAYMDKLQSGAVFQSAILAGIAETRQTVQIADLREDPSYLERAPLTVAAVDLAGIRTLVVVPMLKEHEFVGAIAIYRQEMRPFTDKQIELVKNFAAQAVIAIENTRLLNELRESLERQTATSEVLSVISRSPGDLEPVFQTMLDNATRICEAKFGTMYLYQGDTFRLAASHNAPPALVEARNSGPIRPGPRTTLGQLARTKQVVHFADLMAEQAYIERDPFAVAGVELAGVRTLISVPMLKDTELIGAINVFRQEVRPFTDKQIELVTNFAAQAVIAIENTRLLNELREFAAAADRHRRRAQGHQPLDVRFADRTGDARAVGSTVVRGR